MTLTDQLPDRIKNATPLYAVVGAGDLVVEKVRARRPDLDPAAVPATLATELAAVPSRLRALPERAQSLVGQAVTQAAGTYTGLADRGQGLVTRIRSQQSTEDLRAQVKTTVSSAKATRTATKKSARTAASRAKATSTSAKRAAGTARRAATDAADKVGD